MDKTLTFLNSIRNNLAYADYSLIYKSIEEMPNKPLTTAILHKGYFVDRVRINYTEDKFVTAEEVGYIHDEYVIRNLDFGRANEPCQPMFYGAIYTPEFEWMRGVAFLETTKRLRNGILEDEFEEVFTLSRWEILEDIQIVEMVFSENAIANNSSVRASFAHQTKNIPDNFLRQHYIEQLRFFSDEFAKKNIYSPADYKISAAFANYIWRRTKYPGITYASVNTDYRGQNICLTPIAADKYLRLHSLGMFKASKKKEGNLEIDGGFKYCRDFGINNMNFMWRDFEKGIIF